jgi:hypothetical protein
LPIASDLAMVDGLTGRTASPAVLEGRRDRGAARGLRAVDLPRRLVDQAELVSSPNALSTFVSSEPDAIGTTTCGGMRQPSCSATS